MHDGGVLRDGVLWPWGIVRYGRHYTGLSLRNRWRVHRRKHVCIVARWSKRLRRDLLHGIDLPPLTPDLQARH
jgi:hypothetical protein